MYKALNFTRPHQCIDLNNRIKIIVENRVSLDLTHGRLLASYDCILPCDKVPETFYADSRINKNNQKSPSLISTTDICINMLHVEKDLDFSRQQSL